MSQDILDPDDRARLEFTLNTREQIVRKLMANGQLPSESSDKTMLMQALDGLDRTTLTKAKIKADDKANQQQQNTTRLIADILSRFDVKTTAQRRESLPVLDAEFSEIKTVDGETAVGVQPLTYNEFMQNPKE